MPSSRAGRVRRTEEQWIEIFRRLQSSGVSAQQFCRREGLALSSLQNWRRRLKVKSAAPARFVELVPAAAAEAHSAPWSLEVSLPNGVCLRFRG